MAQSFKDPAGTIKESPTVVLFNSFFTLTKMAEQDPMRTTWMVALITLDYLRKRGIAFTYHVPGCTCEEDNA